jgi:hypothetical protein
MVPKMTMKKIESDKTCVFENPARKARNPAPKTRRT